MKTEKIEVNKEFHHDMLDALNDIYEMLGYKDLFLLPKQVAVAVKLRLDLDNKVISNLCEKQYDS